MILAGSLVAESAEKLLTVGTREHAWFILSSPETQDDGLAWSLSHAGSRDEDGVYRPMRRFEEQPTVIAALGNNIWLAMDPMESRPNQIPIRLLQMNWDSRLDRYVPVPTGGFKLLPSVQIEPERAGVPVDLVATSMGPTMLIAHDDGSYSAQEFRQGRWGAMGLPPLTGTARLGTVNDELVLLDVTDTTVKYWWKSDEGWSAPEVMAGLGPIIEIVQVDDQLLIGSESESDRFALDFLGPQGVASLGTWPQEQEKPWSILGYRGRPVLARTDQELELSQIDPLTGVQDSWRVFARGSPLTMSLWPVLVAFAASAIVLFILLRSSLLPVPERIYSVGPHGSADGLAV